MSGLNFNVSEKYLEVWDKYSEKYNLLIKKLEDVKINPDIIDEILDLRIELTKIKIDKKIDELLSI